MAGDPTPTPDLLATVRRKAVNVSRAWFGGRYEWGDEPHHLLGEPMRALPASTHAKVLAALEAARTVLDWKNDAETCDSCCSTRQKGVLAHYGGCKYDALRDALGAR